MVFDPISALILGVIVAGLIHDILYIAFLIWSILVEWFQQYQYLATQNTNVAATVKTTLASGEYAIVQGIFDRNTGDPVKARIIKYDNLDSQVRNAHSRHELVVWQ